MTPDKLTEAALACVNAGVSIIPIDHRQRSRAAGCPWKPYQQCIADEATVRKWLTLVQSFAVEWVECPEGCSCWTSTLSDSILPGERQWAAWHRPASPADREWQRVSGLPPL